MLRSFLLGLIRFYQKGISPWTRPSCRYVPTCSAYAVEAIERYGSLRGSWMAARRIGRCHPFGGKGFDPVPPGPAVGAGDPEPPLRGEAQPESPEPGPTANERRPEEPSVSSPEHD